eukprot:COSAG06_NODE_11093_length_1568_cov_1.129340_1_plen_354_part_00
MSSRTVTHREINVEMGCCGGKEVGRQTFQASDNAARRAGCSSVLVSRQEYLGETRPYDAPTCQWAETIGSPGICEGPAAEGGLVAIASNSMASVWAIGLMTTEGAVETTSQIPSYSSGAPRIARKTDASLLVATFNAPRTDAMTLSKAAVLQFDHSSSTTSIYSDHARVVIDGIDTENSGGPPGICLRSEGGRSTLLITTLDATSRTAAVLEYRPAGNGSYEGAPTTLLSGLEVGAYAPDVAVAPDGTILLGTHDGGETGGVMAYAADANGRYSKESGRRVLSGLTCFDSAPGVAVRRDGTLLVSTHLHRQGCVYAFSDLLQASTTANPVSIEPAAAAATAIDQDDDEQLEDV